MLTPVQELLYLTRIFDVNTDLEMKLNDTKDLNILLTSVRDVNSRSTTFEHVNESKLERYFLKLKTDSEK